MNLNSRLFDRIRMRPVSEEIPGPETQRCNHPGCAAAGEHRAPMGRDREGQYFSFCLEHVRAYNATYNYFAGMSDEAVARYQKEAIVGHRPTWSMGSNRTANGHREAGDEPLGGIDPLGIHTNREQRRAAPKTPRYALREMKALATLGLDDSADAVAIKARYKETVKRLHPDANGGDRSSEDKLREIIHAYNCLKSAKLV
jgi:hypothetical protein